MNLPFWICVVKTVLDTAITVSFAVRGRVDLAVMFAGYALADAGAAWVAR